MKRRGFTLVEIMIVVAVICLLAGVAITNLSRARITGQESNAAANLNGIALAQIQYRTFNGTFTTLDGLAGDSPPFIDSFLGSGTKQGYNYMVDLLGGSTFQFYACAVHQQGQGHTFYVDSRGNFCRSVNIGQACPDQQTSSQMQLTGRCTALWAGLQESSGGGATMGKVGGATVSPGGGAMGLE